MKLESLSKVFLTSIYLVMLHMMAVKHILFIRPLREELRDYLRDALGNTDVKLHFDSHDIGQVHCIVGWRPEISMLRDATRLELFINPGTGVQHLMGEISEFFIRQDITLINGHGSSYFTAQHAVAMLLSLTNKLLPHHRWMQEGLWRRGDDYAKSQPLRDINIGLLGYGAINSKIHQFLSVFDVDFLILKRDWNGEERKSLSVSNRLFSRDQLEYMLAEVDALIVALPLTSETRGILGRKQLALMKSNSVLINVGRGDLIDEDALYEALSNKRIQAAAIDVWYDYSPEEVDGRRYPYHKDHPFQNLDNILLSPHRAASPFDDLKRWDEVIHNLRVLVDGGEYINQVDLKLGY